MPPYQSADKPRRSLDTIGILALFASIVVSTFVFIPSLSVPFLATKSFALAAGALVSLALYILARLVRGNVILPPLMLVGALWLPVVAYALSTAFSGVSLTSAFWGSSLEQDTLGFMLAVTMLGTLAALSLRRSENLRSFLHVGAWAFGVLVAIQLLIVIVGQFAPTVISPAFSIVGSISNLAILLGLGVIGILVSLREMKTSSRTHRQLVAVGVGSLVLLAIANNSLVWTLLALVSLGFFVESVMRRKGQVSDVDMDDVAVIDEGPIREEEGNSSLVLPLVVLAVSLFFIVGGTLGGALANAVKVNEVNVRPSWQSTFAVANETFSISPIFGTGPGTFKEQWLKYRDASLNSTVFWNIDFSSGIGFIPTSFVTTGTVGIIAWVVFLSLFVVFGLRMLILRAPQDPLVRHVAMLSFLASLYLFTLAVFDLPGTVVLALAFFFVGVFASTTRFAKEGRQWGIVFARSPRIGFVIVFFLTIILLGSVAAAYSLIGRYIAITELTSANVAASSNDFEAADRAIKNSISFAPSADAYKLEANIAHGRLSEIMASTTMSPPAAQKAFQEALSAGINSALTATTLAPFDYQNWLALGNLYAQAVPLGVGGAYDSAKASYDKAKELNPTNPQIPYILAQLNIANKNIKEARENLIAAISLKQNYTAAIFLLSQLEVQDGNVRDALSAALAAAYFTPNDPNILFQVGILYAAQNDFANSASALSAAVAANPQFANARYFLSAVYKKLGDNENALKEMRAIAEMSEENAKAVQTQLADLTAGKNPFPANFLSVSSTPVEQ